MIARCGISSKFSDRKSKIIARQLQTIMIELPDRSSEIQRSNMVDSERKSYFWSERRRFLGVPSLRIRFWSTGIIEFVGWKTRDAQTLGVRRILCNTRSIQAHKSLGISQRSGRIPVESTALALNCCWHTHGLAHLRTLPLLVRISGFSAK